MFEFATTIILGAISTFLVSVAIQRTVFTLGTLFSLVWLIVLSAHVIVVRQVGYDEVPDISYQLLNRTLQIMFFGFALAQFLVGRSKVNIEQFRLRYHFVPRFVSRYYAFVLMLVLVTSFAAFIEAGANFDLSFSFLSDVRSQHVNRTSVGFFTSLSIYVFLFLSAFFILLAFADFISGKPRVFRIVWLLIAIAPLSLSKGSRLEFIVPLLHYLVAFWYLLQFRQGPKSSPRAKLRTLKRLSIKIAPVALALLLIFTAYGNIRSDNKNAVSERSIAMRVLLPIAQYAQSSLISVGTISYWIDANTKLGIGRQYFEVFAKVPQVLGLIEPVNNKKTLRESFDSLGWVVYTPGTMIRHIVSDFGIRMLPLAAFFIAVFSVWFVHGVRPHNLLILVFAVLVTYDVFATFHKVALFSMANGWILFFAYAAMRLTNHYSRRAFSHGAP